MDMSSPSDDYPGYFYENASIFQEFFKRLDQKTTKRKKKSIGSQDIAPAWFGATIIASAQQGFSIIQRVDPAKKAAYKEFFKNTFLNLIAWYIFPLIFANNHKCPYMPREWITNFLDRRINSDPQNREDYFQSILEFMEAVKPKWWITPYKSIASQIGKDAQEAILIFVGMFLEACEEKEAENEQPLRKKLPPAPVNIDCSVSEFIETIEAIDKLRKDKGDTP